MERNYKLYVHISPSGKRYYGITSLSPKDRWKNGKGYRNQVLFYRAINKYGWYNFQHDVLFNNLTEDEAKLLEQFYIALYDTTNPSKGYNITLGGEGSLGISPTEETRKKLSEAHKGEKNHNYGKIFSEETRKKLSESHKGKIPWNKGKTGIYTEETKKKIGNTRAKNGIGKGNNHPMYGKHHTEETKEKISEANKGKKHTEETKKKISEAQKGKNGPSAKSVICITTGRIFYTIKEASEYYNINRRNISACCLGKRKSSGKLPDGTKLIWKYLNYKHNKKYRVVNNKEVA